MKVKTKQFILFILLGITVSLFSQDLIKSSEPQYQFSSTLTEQIKELKGNPTLKRFARSRELMRKDTFHPNYHFLAPENHIGDPNGLTYWNGNWHLFYQFRGVLEPKAVHWGHAYSKDLIHWKDLPIAIYPEPGIANIHQCFSGGTVAEKDQVVALYHLTGKGNQVEVSSDDLLLNWKKIRRDSGLVTIPSSPIQNEYGSPYRVWDPSIWKDGNTYFSLSGIFYGNNNAKYSHLRKTVWHLFASTNLYDWNYSGEFVENDNFTEIGDDGSCSYFWPLNNNKHLLVFFSHRSGSQYFVGTLDKTRQKFSAESLTKYYSGPASATPDPEHEGNVIVMCNEAGGKNGEAANWNGVFSLPKRHWLGDKDILMVEPAGDYASLRSNKVTIGKTALAQAKEFYPEGVKGQSMEIDVVIDPGSSSAIDMKLFLSEDGEEYTLVKLIRGGEPYNTLGGERWTVMIDPTHSSVRPEVRYNATLPRAEFLRFDKEPLHVQLFLDMSVIEVFVNNQASLIERVYPLKKDSRRVSIRPTGNGVVLESLTAWQMGSIWNK